MQLSRKAKYKSLIIGHPLFEARSLAGVEPAIQGYGPRTGPPTNIPYCPKTLFLVGLEGRGLEPPSPDMLLPGCSTVELSRRWHPVTNSKRGAVIWAIDQIHEGVSKSPSPEETGLY